MLPDRSLLPMLLADMFMDGALSGEIEARDDIIRISKRLGDKKTEEYERNKNDGELVLSKAAKRRVLSQGIKEGNQWVVDIEKRCKETLREAMKDKLSTSETARLLKDAVLYEIEPVNASTAFAAPAQKMPKKVAPTRVETKQAWRRAATNKRWKVQRSLYDKKKKTRKDIKILKAQAQTRLRTGWNRWYNNRQAARANENPEVVYMQFSLGRSKEHTDICASRQGMVLPKNDPRWATNTPPLHFGCKSRLLPVTRAAAKEYGIKRWTPREIRDPGYDPAEGFQAYAMEGELCRH